MPIPLVFPNMAALLPGPDVAVRRPEPYTAISALSPFVKSAVEATAAIAKDYRDSRDHQEELEGFASFFDKQGNPQIAELLRSQKDRFRPDPFRSIGGDDVSRSRSSLLSGLLSFARGQQEFDLQERKIEEYKSRQRDDDAARGFSQWSQIVNDSEQSLSAAGRKLEAAELSGDPVAASSARMEYDAAAKKLNSDKETRDSFSIKRQPSAPPETPAVSAPDTQAANDDLRSLNPQLPEGNGDASNNLVGIPADSQESALTEPVSIDSLPNIPDSLPNIPSITGDAERTYTAQPTMVSEAIGKVRKSIELDHSNFSRIKPTTKVGIETKNDFMSSYAAKKSALDSAESAGNSIESTISFIRSNADIPNGIISEDIVRSRFSELKSLVDSLSANIPEKEVQQINGHINKIREEANSEMALLKMIKNNPDSVRLSVSSNGMTASVSPNRPQKTFPGYVDYSDNSGSPVVFDIGGEKFTLRGSRDRAGAYKYTLINKRTNQSADDILSLYENGDVPKGQEYLIEEIEKGKGVLRNTLDVISGAGSNQYNQAPKSTEEERAKKALEDVKKVLGG